MNTNPTTKLSLIFFSFYNDCPFSLGVDSSQLAKQALTRVQGELAKDGREPVGLSSFKVREKFTPGGGKSAIVKYSNKKKGLV